MKRLILLLVGAVVLCSGVAIAATREQPQLTPPGAPSDYFKINPRTCHFAVPEIDVRPTATERYARAEDSRDDVKFHCLANQPTQGYVRVLAQGTHHTVRAVCPKGTHVFGGGSPDEVTGSYPDTNFSWTVVRDHRSPRVLSTWAICAR